jgi:GTPase SAR1 family protein
MPRLIFFCGHAGTGKTTLAHKLIGPLMQATGEPFCLLDKDTLYGRYSAAAMRAITGDPNDRDSPAYLDNLRDPEYEGLLDTARENLMLGISVIVVGPLSREIRAHQLTDPAWLRVPKARRPMSSGCTCPKAKPRPGSSGAATPTTPTSLPTGTPIARAASCPSRPNIPN